MNCHSEIMISVMEKAVVNPVIRQGIWKIESKALDY